MEVALKKLMHNLSFFLRAFALFVLSTVLGTNVLAQSTAALSGTVSDPTGAVIASAKVIATNQATGVESTTQTDTAGAYLFPSLPIGIYRIQVTAPGFQSAIVANLKLEVATATTQNIQLSVGQATEKIEIMADAALVDTTTTGVGQVINDKTVQEIPLNGRHFTDLSLLTTGTVTPPANGFLSAPLRGQGSFGINTAGQREDTTNWLVNGINLNDNVQNQITFQPPIDTLAEYTIDNSTFPAQYGRNAGAIVNLATRSGTNDYHGELFEFFRNNALDARNFFNLASAGPSRKTGSSFSWLTKDSASIRALRLLPPGFPAKTKERPLLRQPFRALSLLFLLPTSRELVTQQIQLPSTSSQVGRWPTWLSTRGRPILTWN